MTFLLYLLDFVLSLGLKKLRTYNLKGATNELEINMYLTTCNFCVTDIVLKLHKIQYNYHPHRNPALEGIEFYGIIIHLFPAFYFYLYVCIFRVSFFVHCFTLCCFRHITINRRSEWQAWLRTEQSSVETHLCDWPRRQRRLFRFQRFDKDLSLGDQPTRVCCLFRFSLEVPWMHLRQHCRFFFFWLFLRLLVFVVFAFCCLL
jgi:hypothetical protein